LIAENYSKNFKQQKNQQGEKTHRLFKEFETKQTN